MANKRLSEGLSRQKYKGDYKAETDPLSNKHLKDRMEFDKKHADEHMKRMNETKAQLKKRGVL